MDQSKLKESGASVRIVPGPSGINFDCDDQAQNGVKFEGENMNDRENVRCNGKHKAHLRDASFSSYLAGGDAKQSHNGVVDNQTKELPIVTGGRRVDGSPQGGDDYDYECSQQSGPKANENSFLGRDNHLENQKMGESNKSGLEKQTFSDRRVPIIGRLKKDIEISIFEAEKYFSAQEEKKMDACKPRTESSKPRGNLKGNIQESSKPRGNLKGNIQPRKQVLFPQETSDSTHRAPSPISFIDADRRGFRPVKGGTRTPSEASWNSRSGLLSNAAGSVNKLPANVAKKTTGKWGIVGFGCPCPCSNRKAVEVDEKLTESRRASSVSNSLSSAVLMQSPSSSIKYSYPGLGKNVLGRSIESQRSDKFVDNRSEVSDANSINGGGGTKCSISTLATIDSMQNHSELQKLQRNSGSLRKYDGEADQEFAERLHQRRNANSSFEKEDGFSFPILRASTRESEEMRRSALEVFGSPIPATPDREDKTHLRQPSDLHRRLVLCSLDKSRKSFTFNSETQQFVSPNGNSISNDDGEDRESDSSSDLFEIESLTTHGTCYPIRKRESVESHLDDASNIQSGYPASCEFENSFHIRGMGELVTPSAQSSYDTPSEASVDWSIIAGDTMDKRSLGKLFSENEEMRMMKRRSLQSSDVAGLRESAFKGISDSKTRSTGGFWDVGARNLWV